MERIESIKWINVLNNEKVELRVKETELKQPQEDRKLRICYERERNIITCFLGMMEEGRKRSGRMRLNMMNGIKRRGCKNQRNMKREWAVEDTSGIRDLQIGK